MSLTVPELHPPEPGSPTTGDELGRAEEWDFTTVLVYAWAVVAAHGWTPTSGPGGRVPTRDLVATLMRGGTGADELLRGLEPYLLQGQRMAPVIHRVLDEEFTKPNGYEARLRALVTTGKLDPEHQLGLAVSAIPAHLRHVDRPLAQHPELDLNQTLPHRWEPIKDHGVLRRFPDDQNPTPASLGPRLTPRIST